MSEPAPHGYTPEFRATASDYYDVDSAIQFLNSPVHPGLERWRCVLCGWAIDTCSPESIGACCCGGCGMTCLRPIAEWRGKH